MTKSKGVTIIENQDADDDDYESDTDIAPGESTPLLSTPRPSVDRSELFSSFRRQRSIGRLSIRASFGGVADNFAEPVEGLAPLFPSGIGAYMDRKYVPYREASLVKSVPAFAPYRRKARHRSFYLYWTNVSHTAAGVVVTLGPHELTPYVPIHRNFVTGGNRPVS